MKIKKIIASAIIAGSIFSFSTVGATPTLVQSVSVPQEMMNAENNSNYVLVWQHLGVKYYIDLSSIVVKQDGDVRWWAQNIVELDENGTYRNQFPLEFCYDTTVDKIYANTRQWNYGTKKWENLNTFDTKSRNQLEARAYNLGYIFAFQGGNPKER